MLHPNPMGEPGASGRTDRWHGGRGVVALGMAFRVRTLSLSAAAAASMATWACGGRGETGASATTPDSAGAAVVPAAAPDSGAASSAVVEAPTAGCPEYAPWRECSVQYRLERAGLNVHKRDTRVHHDWLSVDGIVWETPRSETQVFLYASEADRIADLKDVDTVAVSPKGKRVIWKEPAIMVQQGNLMAIIVTLNGRTAERIALALGAGLPVK